MNVHHKKALAVLALTVALDAVLGTLFGVADHIGVPHGLFCATGYATTDGCDVSPHGWLAYCLGALMMVTMIPLVGVVWAFVTSGITADHVDKRHRQMADHIVTTAGGRS